MLGEQESVSEIFVTGEDEDILHEKINSNPSVLIVEDDDDLRQFIGSILEGDYEVYEAADGREGYEKAIEIIPDFIVSDIMMPEVDGIEFLKISERILKRVIFFFCYLLQRLPSIVSSKDLSMVQMNTLAKPFSVTYFKARVKNLLHRRVELHEIL